jgi:hypothetical protein
VRQTLSIVAVAGLVLASVTTAAPAAFASSGGSSGGAVSAASVTVSPSAVHPGDTVQIQLDCSAYSSPKPSWGSASAFSGPVDLHPMSGQPGFFSASATVSASLAAGSYTISGACAAGDSSSSFQADLTISAADDGQMPSGPAHTGVGGSVTGGDLAQEAGGAALLMAAAVVAYRHRRSRDGA